MHSKGHVAVFAASGLGSRFAIPEPGRLRQWTANPARDGADQRRFEGDANGPWQSWKLMKVGRFHAVFTGTEAHHLQEFADDARWNPAC